MARRSFLSLCWFNLFRFQLRQRELYNKQQFSLKASGMKPFSALQRTTFPQISE